MLSIDGIDLGFDEDALEEIAKIANKTKTGAENRVILLQKGKQGGGRVKWVKGVN